MCVAELIGLLDARAPDEVSAQLGAIVTPRAASSLANLRALGKLDDPRLAGFAIEALVGTPAVPRLTLHTAYRHSAHLSTPFVLVRDARGLYQPRDNLDRCCFARWS